MHLEHAEDGRFGIRERLDFTVSLDPASEVTYFYQFPSENFTADIGVDADRKLFLFSLQNREGTTWYPPQVAADFDAKRIRLAGAVLQNSRYGNSFVVLHCDRSN